jgi:flagellar basal body-associated protein FliL
MDSKKKKYILLSCGVLLIVVIICVVLIAITGVGVSLFWPLGRSSSSVTETPESVIALPDDQVETEVGGTFGIGCHD